MIKPYFVYLHPKYDTMAVARPILMRVEPFAAASSQRAPERRGLGWRVPRQLCAGVLAGGGLLLFLLIASGGSRREERIALPAGSQVGLRTPPRGGPKRETQVCVCVCVSM